MLMSPVPSRWLDIVAADDDILCADINHEAISNMWCFSPQEDESPDITTSGVEKFLLQAIENRRSLVRAHHLPEMLFYCWHDAQTRQLRFSMVSASHGRLPFGCSLRQTDDLRPVVNAVVHDWLNSSQGDQHGKTASKAARPFTLTVFVTPLVTAP